MSMLEKYFNKICSDLIFYLATLLTHLGPDTSIKHKKKYIWNIHDTYAYEN